LAEEAAQIIEELGPKKVVAFVTDNTANVKGSWRILKEKYPWLQAYGCSAHSLDLLLKDILRLNGADKFSKKVDSVVKHLRKSSILSARLNELQIQNGENVLQLVQHVQTRWASFIKTLRRLLKLKTILQSLAVDSAASKY
jgi:hypothetical protein